MMDPRENVRMSFLSMQNAITATFPPTTENDSGLMVRLVISPQAERYVMSTIVPERRADWRSRAVRGCGGA